MHGNAFKANKLNLRQCKTFDRFYLLSAGHKLTA